MGADEAPQHPLTYTPQEATQIEEESRTVEEQAVASVIDVGIKRPAWIARFEDRTTNTLPLREAKAAAIAMAKGACGDYVMSNPQLTSMA